MSAQLDSIGKVTTLITFNAFAEKNLVGYDAVATYMNGQYVSIYSYLLPWAGNTALEGHDRMRFALGKHWFSAENPYDDASYASNFQTFDFDAGLNPYILDFVKDPLQKVSYITSAVNDKYGGILEVIILEEGEHPSPVPDWKEER